MLALLGSLAIATPALSKLLPLQIGPHHTIHPPQPPRLPAPPPIAAGLDRDMVEPAGACPAASGVARVADGLCVW